MQDGKIVVLQALGGLTAGGAESRVMDITRNLTHTNIKYAFLLHDKGPDFYEEEAKALGCDIYRVPAFRIYNIFAYKRALNELFKDHPEIDIVQGHITSSAAIYLPIAKKHGVKVTIAHARSAGVDQGIKGKLTRLLRKKLYKKCDYMWSCSPEASLSVFGREENVRVIPNAINVDKFADVKRTSKIPSDIIKEWNLQDKFVIGHVGSFRYAKNHEFLIFVFEEILRRRDDAVLLLVGEGKLMQDIVNLVYALALDDKVIFAGNHKDVENYYAVMDMIVFPSHYEGLPGTIVEAQAAGVPALISSNITRLVGVTELVRFYGLEYNEEAWANRALEMYDYVSEKKASGEFEDYVANLKSAGFDVVSQVNELSKLYTKLYEDC